jgi:hypothetical protein
VFRAFRDVETLIQFTDGWLVYYNYFRPHDSLEGKTPAEEAHVNYSVKNWKDLASVPVSKETEIDSHKTPTIKIPKVKVNLDKAYKRKRGPMPKTIFMRTVLTHRTPRITPKTPNITKQHFSRRGGGLTIRGDI